MSANTLTKSAPKTAKAAKAAKVAAPKATVLPAVTEAEIIKFNNAKEMIKRFTEEKDAAEFAIRTALGDSDIGIINGAERIVVSHRSRTNINGKTLKEAFPEAYEASAYESEYTVLTTK